MEPSGAGLASAGSMVPSGSRPAPLADTAPWRALPCPRRELRLDLVLRCGQSFRWQESRPGYWSGVLAGRVWTLTQREEQLWFTLHQQEQEEQQEQEGGGGGGGSSLRPPQRAPGPAEPWPGWEQAAGADTPQQILQDYFQLHVGLAELYQGWGDADPHFRQLAAAFPGVRVLRQDPVECLFSFICTSNNHLGRITGMIQRLCQAFGRRLCQLGSEPYHAFPSLQALAAAGAETRLRALGFGYRARFVTQSAQTLLRELGGAEGLRQLRTVSYSQARQTLCALPGVGPKVADCVCLMALDKRGAVPVDTHMWQIARRHYGQALGAGSRSVTARVHRELGDFFRSLWGPYAGWAQAVLFCADLKKFQAGPDGSARPACGRSKGRCSRLLETL